MPADHRVKVKEGKKLDKYQDLPCQRVEKALEHESDSDTNPSQDPWNKP